MDAWECCACKASNTLTLAPTRCPLCPHKRCSSCRIGPPPATLGPFGPLFSAPTRRSVMSSQPAGGYNFYSPSIYTPPSAPPRYTPLSPPRYASLPPNRGVPASPSNSCNAHSGPSSSYGLSADNTTWMHTRPDSSGWWRCCYCLQWNNPAFNTEPPRCFYDQHVKCGKCKTR